MTAKKPSPAATAAAKAARDAQRIAEDAAHAVVDGAKKAAVATHKGAKVAAGATADAAKIVATSTTEFAKKSAKFVDAKTREALAKELAKTRPAAIATLARLRKAGPSSKPAGIIGALDAEFTSAEEGASATSAEFTASAANYVLTLNEIYGYKVRDEGRRAALINIVLAANSGAARAVAQVGGWVLTIVSKRFAAAALVAGVVNFANKHANKLTWLGVVAKLAGIKNPARKSAAWIVITASRRVLGEPPTTWPATAKPAAKKSPVKKPVAKKPAVKRASS